MSAQVVQDQTDSMRAGIAGAEALPSLEKVLGRLALVNDPFDDVSMNIIECQKLLCPSSSGVGRSVPFWMPLSRPRNTRHGSQFHGAELIKAHNMTLWRSSFVKFQNAVFFTSKSGSGDSFQVFVR